SSWYGGALYGQWQVWRPSEHTGLFVTGRTELYFENVPKQGETKATPIFWGDSKYVGSGTIGLDLRPLDKLSFQLEFRRDQAQAPLFFKSGAPKDAKGGYLPTARDQNILVAGATAWF
ncbi:outer membrane beta-barrel protein, partial [Candidatus Peregrinibacteria bacterium]|nr:outer membrane beta-barrel protein [Candidatus Peregrinibacteria bacterium]